MEDDEDLQDDQKRLHQPQQQQTYVAQLHQVFSSCDTTGSGYLGHTELRDLCSQLHLDDQVNLIVEHLLGDDPDAKVSNRSSCRVISHLSRLLYCLKTLNSWKLLNRFI